MSIQSEINRLKQAVSDAFTAIGNKGGTVPSSKVSGNLASAIDSIPEGVELNFEVVGGTTQPSNSKENTIWVKTEKIGAWHFSVTQPEGMQEWDVWFLYEKKSNFSFNALKKNRIMVYPISAKQYVSGALVEVEAKSYRDGEWVEWESQKYVFKSGSGFNAHVYEKLVTSAESIYLNNYKSIVHSISSDNAFITLDANAGGSNICHLAFDIDLTEYKTMYIDATAYKVSGSEAEVKVCVGNEGINNITGLAETRLLPKSDGVRETFTYPVDKITTVKRVVIYTRNTRKAKIHNIWFE